MEAIYPWVALYKEKRRKWDNDIKEFRMFNSTSKPHPNHLK